jgi:dipeptidyl aminopeptidase/acylaminoacyl peptidase
MDSACGLGLKEQEERTSLLDIGARILPSVRMWLTIDHFQLCSARRPLRISICAAVSFITCALGYSAEPRPMQIEDLFRAQRLSDPQISPDGKWVAYTATVVDRSENRTDSDIWIVSVDGGKPKRLTNSPKQDRHARWSPDGKWIVFESNRGGDFQVYLIAADGGEAIKLTSISTEAQQPVWSPNGKQIAFVSAVFPEFSDKSFGESDAANKKKLDEREKSKVKAHIATELLFRHWDTWVEGKRQHLFVVPVKDGAANGSPRDVTPGDRDAVPTSTTFSAGDEFDFSPDGRFLAYTATPEPTREDAWSTNHDIYEVNLETGERRQITTNPAADGLPRYSRDGKYLAYRAQSRPGFESDRWQLMLFDRAAATRRSLTPDFDSWVEYFAWAPDGQTIYFEAEQNATKPIWSVPVSGDGVKKVYDTAVNGEVAVAPDNDTLVFAHQSFERPVELCRVPKNGGDAKFLTHANDELFASMEMEEPASVRFEGARGAHVQMWIIKPPHFDSGKKYPLVFWVHGGPQGAFTDAWSFRWNPQLWAAQGYVLALPNPRGSTGFGQQFLDEVSHDWGGAVFTDLMNGLAYLEKQPSIDSSRMAAAGASFGGYMMNWFQGHTDKFKTLVTHCGVYNFWNMYGATEEIWFDEWEHGIPWKTANFDRFSPHRFAANFKTPNLVIHNELDFRVPFSEGLNLFTTLQRKGVPSKLLSFPDEGHWVLKPQNSELWHKTVFDWLEQYLR